MLLLPMLRLRFMLPSVFGVAMLRMHNIVLQTVDYRVVVEVPADQV